MLMATFQVTLFHHLSRCSHPHPQLSRGIFLQIHSPQQPSQVSHRVSLLSIPIDAILLQIPLLHPHHLPGLRCLHLSVWRIFASSLSPATHTPSWISSSTIWWPMQFMKDWLCWSNSLVQDYTTPTSTIKLQTAWQADNLKNVFFFSCDQT